MIYELIGQSSYDPASPNRIYFSIGSAIAAIALFLAFTQLIRPIVKFRLATGIFRQNVAYVLFLIAIVFVFVAAILPFIPRPALPLLGYPVFWEIAAGILFATGSIGLLWKINRRAKFNSRNYKHFLKWCTSLIAKGNEYDLRELADEIFDSIKTIVKACKKYDSNNAHFAKKDGKQYEISEYTEYALTLLDIWSDEKFCQLMICYVPRTANEIFSQITKQRLYYSGGHALVGQLVRQAFINKTSILYREEDYFGLGHFKIFTNTVFGNCELIESNLNPLRAWGLLKCENLEPWKIEKYCEVLNVATQAHIVSGWHRGYRIGLAGGFDNLTGMAGIVWSQAYELDSLPDEHISKYLPWKNLHAIVFGLEEAVDILQKHEVNIPEYKLNEANYDKFRDDSIYGVIAYAIFNFFQNLSVSRSKDETVRMLAVSLWLKVYPVSKGMESKAIVEIQKRLNIYLFKKFEENLKELHYPALTRLWINLIGLQKDTEDCGAKFVKEKLFELLRSYYEKAVKADAKKAKDMLPDKVRHDKKKGQLIQKYPSGSTSVLDLR